jgi:hypothetical protein
VARRTWLLAHVPLPQPSLLFLPLFSTVALGVTAFVGLLTCAVLALGRTRA